ncbi:MAG: AarF/ABC1/UbiB kinase family protein [Syntrophomonadaceae bacterium]|nr:AarF/ABC1/UbiB kinase family protein [Syntrophomonadaceae bacterium]MDD4561956.1 AarF/ABC1/UbiB kinase family protein [Syntrophomonadaceae bacterium]
MKISRRLGMLRFFRVIKLFVDIFWAFYSLKFKRIWHNASWVEVKRQELYKTQARYFRDTAVQMGGLLIKLGQFFSTRVDILPRISIDELAGLQDEVPAVEFAEIKEVIETEFARPIERVFAQFDCDALASASLGQVHRGHLSDGSTVAIKVQRPGIDELVAVDLRAIYQVIKLIKIFTNWGQVIDFDAIFVEFKETLQAELDYIQEGHNAETIAKNSQDDPDIIIPGIYWDFTTRRVLTMEYLEGIKVTDHKLLLQSGINRQAIAAKLLQTYVKQMLIDGFYHADPHPGNLFVTPEGKLIMVDFGMTGSIPPHLRQTLVEMVFALVNRDYAQVTEYLKELGFIRYDYDNQALNRAISIFLEELVGSGQDLSSLDLQALLRDLETLFYEQPFQVPANFTFLGRALGTLYGICVGLDPGISFIDVAKPYVKQIAPERDSIFRIVKDRSKLIGNALLDIPPLMQKALIRVERGELNLTPPLQNINHAIEQNTRVTRSLVWSIVFGFSLLTSAYLLVNGLKDFATYLMIFSIIIFLLLLKTNRKPTRKKAPHPPVMIKRGK